MIKTIYLFFIIIIATIYFLSMSEKVVIEPVYPNIAIDITKDFGTPMIYEHKTIYPKVKK